MSRQQQYKQLLDLLEEAIQANEPAHLTKERLADPMGFQIGIGVHRQFVLPGICKRLWVEADKREPNFAIIAECVTHFYQSL